MPDAKHAAQVTRDTILKLLSDEENARVATGEAEARLSEGDEYLDLLHLDQGVQRAGITMGHFLPRSAVSDETWHKILAHLDGGTLAKPTPFQARARSRRSALSRPRVQDPLHSLPGRQCAAHRHQFADHAGHVLVLLAIAGLGNRNRRARIWRLATHEKIIDLSQAS